MESPDNSRELSSQDSICDISENRAVIDLRTLVPNLLTPDSSESESTTLEIESSNRNNEESSSSQGTSNASNRNSEESSSSQGTSNASSRSSSKSSMKSKLPARTVIVPKSSTKSGEKLSSVSKQTSNRNEVTPSSKRNNSPGNILKNFAAENERKKNSTTVTTQSRRASIGTKPNINTSISSNNPRRNSLSDQRNILSQTKSRIDTGLRKDHPTKALDKPSVKTKIPGIVNQSKSPVNSNQPIKTAIQSKKKVPVTTEDQKSFQQNGSRLTNIQTPKYFQNKTKPQSFHEKTSPSFGQLSLNSLPSVNKLSPRIQSQPSLSSKNEIQGRFMKDSINQLPQGTKNEQTLNKEDLMVTSNKSNETISLASTSLDSDKSREKLVEGRSHAECSEVPSESSIEDEETEFSEEQRMSGIDCKFLISITSPTNDGKTTCNEGNIKSLCLREIENEKFSFDEVENSSMVLERDDENLVSNPGVSETSTINFGNKTLLEEQRNEEFSEFYRNEKNVMKGIFKVKSTYLATMLKAEQYIMETMFLANQERPEIYSQIQEGAISVCTEIENETMDLISVVKEKVKELEGLMKKSTVERLQTLKSRDREYLQTRELGEISRESNDLEKAFTEREEKPQEFKKGGDERGKNCETRRHKKILNKFVSLTYSLIKDFIPSVSNKILLATLRNILEDDEQKQYLESVEEIEELKFVEGEEAAVKFKKPQVLRVEESKKSVKGEAEEVVPKKSHFHLGTYSLKSHMSYLPTDENVELPFLDKIKEAIRKSVSHSEEEGTETSLQDQKMAIEPSLQNDNIEIGTEISFLDEQMAIELSLQNDNYTEFSFQDEQMDIERSLDNNKRIIERLPSLQNQKEFVEVSVLPSGKIVSQILPLENENDIQLNLPKRENVDMSYLPKDEAVELQFLNIVKEAVEISIQNEKEVVERPLEDENTVENTSQKVKEIELAIQNQMEAIESSSVQKVHEFVDMSSLYDKEALEITLVNRETVVKNLSNKQHQSELDNMGVIQTERDIEAEEKALHQPSVKKKIFCTQETEDISNCPNKKEILEESISPKTRSNELKLSDKEEISEQITPKHERFYITDRDTLTEALEALMAETID